MLTPLLLLLAAGPAASPADPVPIESRIADVTLYGTSAMVHRTARLEGSGSFVITGLPQTMDKDNVRVRCAGGDVVSVEVRERLQPIAPNERVQGLRERLKALGRDLQAARDDVRVVEEMGKYLASLSDAGAKAFRADVEEMRDGGEAWSSSFAFLQAKLIDNARARREAGWRAEEVQRAHEEIEREIGRLTSGGNVTVRDVLVDVEAAGAATLDVEYLVSRTGWQPYYDLRTSSDLSSVDLSYRARIHQQSGEDWNDVAIALSTAQPQRGAQGPEPVPQWITIREPRASRRSLSGSVDSPAAAPVDARKGAGEAGDDAVLATVEDQGLSVRFQLARRETIESREQPTTVLVGRATLEVAAERFCVPAVDPTVWLRGKAKNSSAWALLPGNAAVFLGADYLGLAHIGAVQPGQELTLHLGADPAITVTRTQTEDMAKGPGFLSSRAEKIEGWRVHLENHGARTANPSGAVDVIVREVLPRSRDERVEVELSKSEPKPASDERWKQDLEEKGIRTWVVHVPRGGTADLVWQATISYPKGADLVRH